MFGDLMGMMGKLKETQKKVEEAKARLKTIMLEETGADQAITVKITADRSIEDITIDPSLLGDKEALQDYLVITLNKAIAKASEVHDKELAAAAKDGLPNIPGMDSLFK